MEKNAESERFIQVAQAEDPFTADALEAVLRKAGMAVLRTEHPGGSGGEALGTGWALPWGELGALEGVVGKAEGRVAAGRLPLTEGAPDARPAPAEAGGR